jgi:multimeric flavodoxin WrbA
MLGEKIIESDAVLFATPVYWGDLSESLKSFLDRLRRTYWHRKGEQDSLGRPAVGICVAGGGGGGAPSCCRSLEKVLHTCGMDVLDVIPVRRQNLEMKLDVCERVGRWVVESGIG